MGVRGLLAAERAELIELLRTLSDDEWAAPSLCAGWQVRDVIGHLLWDTLTPLSYAGLAIRNRLAVDRINGAGVTRARQLTTSELLRRFESETGRISKYWPTLGLADMFVHQQDIRRPLNRPRTIPAERLTTVLDHPDPFALPWRLTRGLRFIATDIGWSKGSGPEVSGPGEAIALAMVGRPIALGELDGDGLPELRKRCG